MMRGVNALVTGASSGLGKSIAVGFARRGANVAVADLNYSAAKDVASEIAGFNLGKSIALNMDVTSEQSVDAGFGEAQDFWGAPVNCLISNAGTQHISPLIDLEFSEWKKMLAVHLDGSFLTTRALMRGLDSSVRQNTKRNGMGKSGQSAEKNSKMKNDGIHISSGFQPIVIYMGSVHSKEASVNKGPYVTAKHGLLGLTRLVAKEGASMNLRSNIVCPGFVKTPLVVNQIPLLAKELGMTNEQVVSDVMLKNTVDGEFTTEQDITQICVDLVTFPSAAMTGQSITLSHGWNMS